MKTAVLLSGQARTFARCLPTLDWCVFRKLPDPSFFVSFADDKDAASAELLRSLYPEAVIEIEKITQPTLPEPAAQFADHAPYAISSPVQAILRQLWHLSRVWKFAEEKAKDANLLVRCRPDLHFHRFEMALEGSETAGAKTALVPWWDNYGGVNDRFAILGREAAKAYFETWDNLPKLLADGCPLHPESLVCAALEAAGITINRTLRAEFSCRRANGELIFPKPQPGEMLDYIVSSLK